MVASATSGIALALQGRDGGIMTARSTRESTSDMLKGDGSAAVSTETADAVRQAFAELLAEKSSTNAGEAVKSPGIKTDKVADEIAAALSELFSGKDTVGADETFDEELYAKAKPLFERLLKHALQQEAEQRADHESILRTIAEAQRIARE